MKRDRLRADSDEIHNLNDLIEARKAVISRFADDVDSLPDIDVLDDTDVEEALTFPHPKRNKRPEIDLMSTPHEEDIEDDQQEWARREMLPSDYSHQYSECSSSFVTDDEDEITEELVHDAGRLCMDDIAGQPPVEQSVVSY